MLVKVSRDEAVSTWFKREAAGASSSCPDASNDVNAGQHHEHHAGLQPGAGKPQCAACRAIRVSGGESGRVPEGGIPDCRPRLCRKLEG